MEGIEYKKVARVRLDNDLFNIYIDKMHSKFYLKCIGEKLVYPTLEEFQRLNKIFSLNSIGLYANFKENGKGTNITDSKNVKFVPKVIHKGAKISLLAALILSMPAVTVACKGNTEKNMLSNENSIENEYNTENATKSEIEYTTGEIATEPTQPSIQNMTDKELLEYYGVEYEELKDGTLAVKKMEYSDNSKYTYVDSIEEFKGYAGINKKIDFNDLRQAINERADIEDKFKNWVNEGINNLEASGQFNEFDFSVLYHNLKRFYIEYQTSEEILQNSGKSGIKAQFWVEEGKVVINSQNVDRTCFLHELFGHGLSQGMVEVNCEKYQKVSQVRCAKIVRDGNNSFVDTNLIGSGLEEGKADMITFIADGGMQTQDLNCIAYPLLMEQLRVYMELTDTNVSDFMNTGTKQLIKNMNDVGIEDTSGIIDSSDVLVSGYTGLVIELDKEQTTEYNIKRAFEQYAEKQLKDGASKDSIKAKVESTKNGRLFDYVSSGSLDSIDILELGNVIKAEIDNMEINKNEFTQEVERD